MLSRRDFIVGSVSAIASLAVAGCSNSPADANATESAAGEEETVQGGDSTLGQYAGTYICDYKIRDVKRPGVVLHESGAATIFLNDDGSFSTDSLDKWGDFEDSMSGTWSVEDKYIILCDQDGKHTLKLKILNETTLEYDDEFDFVRN